MINETPISTIMPQPNWPGSETINALGQATDSPSLETLIAAIDQSIEDQHQALPTGDIAASAQPLAQGKYIIFSLADARYAVPINQVVEVGEAQHITPVPNAPTWVLGVTNLRGDIISVVDCGAFLNLHEKIAIEMSSMCVVRNKKRDLTTSLLVDRIDGMLNLMEEIIPLPESGLEDELVPYLQGVYEHEGQLLKIINLEGLLSSLELTA